jgi:uncharacterized protein with NAD-binding domain and iron-sulfur cluster
VNMTVPYVDYGGTQMLSPPYVAENVQFYAFVVPADLGALQKLVDDRLNLPTGGTEHFEPAGPFVIFAFNNLGKMYSQNPPDSGKGWFSEQECAIWMRVVDRKRERSLWFHPYMFVDDSYALVLGREVYGFPKAIGWFQIPDQPEHASSLTLETLVLEKFSPDTPGKRMKLIQATKTRSSEGLWKIVETASRFAEEILGGLDRQDGLGEWELVLTSLLDLVQRKEPMVFLKQFPTPDMPGTACYQAIVENSTQATALHGVSLLPGKWQIDIGAADSHPIARDLGLSGNSIPSVLQIWVSFDMVVGFGTNVWTASAQSIALEAPKKIAILGGGMASVAAALELTNAKDWQRQYDITLYQMGWRLGGKGASGRGMNSRIEEHGLHIWFGFYENAFRMIQRVYRENEVSRPPGTPLREWSEAFKPDDFVAVTDRVPGGSGGQWDVWPFRFLPAPGYPGDGLPQTFWESVCRWIEILERTYSESFSPNAFWDFVRQFWTSLGHWIRMTVSTDSKSTFHVRKQSLLHIQKAKRFAHSLSRDPRQHKPSDHLELAKLLESFRDSERKRAELQGSSLASDARRLFEIFDLGATVAIGLLVDGYVPDPSALDNLEEEMQVWLRKHGASPLACDVRQSAVLRALYDLVFAYIDGDVSQPSFEAGVAVRCMLLIMASYKGSILWKMQAGMGDVIFGPIYEVLKKRGVKFEFFHRVSGLELNLQGTAVDAIQMDVQATLRDPQKEYAPLSVCEKLPACWPAQPLYEQLEQGKQLEDGGFDLESFWTTWKNPGTKTLKAGEDFDQIVLGISIGGLPYLFSNAKKLPRAFQLMLQQVKTVSTQSMQLWVNRRLEDLGWQQGTVVLDGFADPLNTWGVMDHLLPRENWPAGSIQGLHYFCGPMAGGIPPRDDPDAPAEALNCVRAAGEAFIQDNLPVLWPKMNSAGFKIESRYNRANIDPSERYVLSVAGSTKYRLRANESGLANVVLAGDWTKNGFNAGCVESATMSGIQAANAIQGRPLNYGIMGPLATSLQMAAKTSPDTKIASQLSDDQEKRLAVGR